jgi:microcystin-dependent protein
VKIRADFHDSEDNTADGLSATGITKDGQTAVTQNIPMNSHRIISLADPIDLQDAATKDYADTTSATAVTAAVPPGSLMDFAMAAAPTGWLVCDGAAVSRTTYAALFAAIGTIWGAGDGSTTFNVPGMLDRFRRQRGAVAGSVGTLQASQNLSHTHNVNGNTGAVSADHSHHVDFMSQAADRSLDHVHSGIPQQEGYQPGPDNPSSGGQYVHPNDISSGGVVGSIDHLHRILGDTGGISANHSHSINVSSGGGTADGTEARPLSATVLTCIKT